MTNCAFDAIIREYVRKRAEIQYELSLRKTERYSFIIGRR